jgi:hypothetical protein
MAPRELCWVARLVDGEPPGPIRTLQVLEAIDRHPGSARRKLKQTGLSVWRPATDALPEPLDDFVRLFVSTIIGVLDPVVAAKMCLARERWGRWEERTCRSLMSLL